jgi:valyl-tRNA synthetase
MMGGVPFHDVIIHSTVLAPDGRRMSKSLGTGIDPLDVIAEYGADATRYGLLKMSSTQDTRFSYPAIDEGRRLTNKLWNVSRLILANTEGASPGLRPAYREERWILGRLEIAKRDVEAAMRDFDFAAVARALYRVTFDDFCDWYAEAIKPRLYERDDNAAATALAALERLLALLHPVLPHVSEEIWSQLPARERRLIVSPWPQADARFEEAATALDRVQDAAAIFRRSGVTVALESDEQRIFDAVVRPDRARVDGRDVIEMNRLGEVERLRKEIARAEGILANEGFVTKAAPEIIQRQRENLERYRRELDALLGA